MIAQRIPVLSGGFSLAAFMAQQSDGFWYDFTQTAGLFQTTDTSTPVTAFGDNIGRATDLRAAATATQSTTSFRPKYQSTGAAFDGADDNLLTGYTAGSGANFLVAKVVVPASISGNAYFLGQITDANNRFALGATTSGLRALAGGNAYEFAISVLDQTVVMGVTTNGSTVRTFVGTQALDQATLLSGSVGGAIPHQLGALNNAGTASAFFGGSIQHVLAGREFLDLARFIQIANALGG